MKKNYIPPAIEIHQVHVENGYACSFEDRPLIACTEGMTDGATYDDWQASDGHMMEGIYNNGCRDI